MQVANWIAGLLLFAAALPATGQERAEVQALERDLAAALAEAEDARADSGFDSLEYLAAQESVSIASHELAVGLSRVGKMDEATPHYRRAFDMDAAAYGLSDPATLNSGNSLATNLNFLGQYSDAEALLRSLLLATDGGSARLRNLRWTVVNTLAGSLTGQNRLPEAEQILRGALQQIELDGTPFDRALAVLMTNNLAHNLHEQKRYRAAEPLFRQVVDHYANDGGTARDEAILARHNLAANRIDLGHYAEALPLARQVFEERLARLGPEHPDTLTSRKMTGLAYLGLGETGTALDLLEGARSTSEVALGDRHPDTLSAQIALATALLRTGERKAEAVEPVLRAAAGLRERLDRIGFEIGDQARFARDLDTSRAAHELLVEAAWHSDRADRFDLAFLGAQIVLSGTTSRAVAEKAAARVAEAAGLQQLLDQRQAISREWQDIDGQLLVLAADPQSSDADPAALARQQQALAEDVARIDARLEASAPDYFDLIRPQPLDRKQAQRLLGYDEAALLVIPTEYATHVFLVTRDCVEWTRSEWTTEQIDAAVERLRWDVGASVDVDALEAETWAAEGQGAYPFDFRTAHALYDELVAPVEQALDGRRLLFIATSGQLSNMPLGILVGAVPDGPSGAPETLRKADWFADRIAQVHVPSLSSLAFLRRHRDGEVRSAGQAFLGFGDPVLTGSATLRGAKRGHANTIRRIDAGDFVRAAGSQALASPEELRKMARLPGTARELQSIWEAVGKPDHALFLAGDATESRVRSTPLVADIISFATHGLLAGEVGGLVEPGLVLSPPARATAEDDGYLSSSEIAQLEVSSRWVILSACNTAGGSGKATEGFSGLARSFFFAGARTLMVSHWPVRDDVAARMTVHATELSRGDTSVTPAQALQVAMRAIRDDPGHDTANDTWAHPNAWAPFVLVGDR